tara:strand:+ start:176 stop:754 length:579 start_codon:yes stop_codon:yes gene_type:complete
MQEISYIGLDISTSIIGICFLDSNSDLVLLDNINLKKTKSMFSKSEIVKNRLIEYKNSLKFTKNIKISIEEAFQSFSAGFSSAKTLSQLNRFNGIVSYLVYYVFSIEPLYINVNSARKNLQIKIDRKSKKSTKEQVFEWARTNLNSEFNWPEKILKSGPNKGRVKFDESCYDMSDAFVICKALIFNEESNNK